MDLPSPADRFSRTTRLLGDDILDRFNAARVIIFGVGGVGSWCAEALVRTGISHLTIVDFDRVSASNINRQLMATCSTVGEVKVDALARRLLDINPDLHLHIIPEAFSPDNAPSFNLASYTHCVDAIDSLASKAALILEATRIRHLHFYSSMGAALKLDPTRVMVAEFWKVKGCPLARALRQRFKRMDMKPSRKFKCVYSDELLPNLGSSPDLPTPGHSSVNGSLVHITGIFGFTLAGLLISDLTRDKTE